MTKVKKEIAEFLSDNRKIQKILEYHAESEGWCWISDESIEQQRRFQGPRRAEMVHKFKK